MSQVVIENPIINSPFDEPTRHFRFSDEGITNEVVEGRRVSSYFIPIAKPKKKGSHQLQFDTDWTQDRIEENKRVNDIRHRIALWRKGGYVGVTPTTARLISYWTDPNREKKLFFCQIEALETAIYIAEVAKKYGDAWIDNAIQEANDTSNPGLPRMAFKMATGSGKTVVMAMLIAWNTFNKLANTKDARFSDTFLIITPGITIRDRLRVLLPNDPENYYRQRDIVPSHLQENLGQAKILITNYHAFLLREKIAAGKITKSILANGQPSPFTETPDQMVRRVCRDLSTKKNIIVLNDEAHHCYRRKPGGEDESLSGDDRIEAKQRDEEARVWISGIEAVKAKIGVKSIYDLSATPFFLRGSGYPEGTLFPWVVSDFSLIDAIEAGIVKVPRVPVADDSMVGEQPTYRDLWLRIRDHLPKKGRKSDEVTGEPKLPVELQGALLSLYGNYEKYYRMWEQNSEARARGITPPVFIVVCNNTNVSKLVFDYIAGWEKQVGERTIVQAGQLPIFRNDDASGAWLHRPNTVLVDSQQLESGESMSDDFKKIAAREIDEFKTEYRTRFPGLFISSVNCTSTILFPLEATVDQTRTVLWLRFVAAHAVATAAGGAFMFCSVLALAGLLMSVLPYRRFRQISTIVQFAVVTTLVMLLFLTPEIGTLVRTGGRGHAFVDWLPTVWFLGMYQALSSEHARANFDALTIRAILGLSAAAGGSLCFWIVSYRRCSLRIPEIADVSANGEGKLAQFKEDCLNALAPRQAYEGACFRFAAKTVARSQRHALVLAGFSALGTAIAIQDLTSSWEVLGGAARVPTVTLLAAPAAIIFFLLTGLVFVFGVPAELSANWLFQSISERRCDVAQRVARRLMLIFLAPLVVLVTVIYSAAWGVRLGLEHAAFVFVTSWMLIEALLIGFRKIPFTCSYSSAKYNVGIVLLVYFLAFLIFSPGLASGEHLALSRSVFSFLILLAVFALAAVGIRWYARELEIGEGQLLFADEREPIVPSMELR